MKTVAIIQARMGSSRLPGKVFLPLAGEPTLRHVIRRVRDVPGIDTVVVATSKEARDDVIARFAPEFGSEVVRGPESDVLERFWMVSKKYDPDTIIRITADCPIISRRFLDHALSRVSTDDAEYVSAAQERTFPRGVTAEVFTAASFRSVYQAGDDQRHREHVTPYYREHPEEFTLSNVVSTDVFDDERLHDRTDLRLTLDEAVDYELLETVYGNVEYDDILSVRAAVEYIDEAGIADLNATVEQKTV